MDDLTVEQAIEQKRLRAQAVLLWRPGATAAQWEQAAKEASGDVLDLLAVVGSAQALAHFLDDEKETKEPPSALLDLGYAALESAADHQREEDLLLPLLAALARLAAPAVREIPPVPATTVYVEGHPGGFR